MTIAIPYAVIATATGTVNGQAVTAGEVVNIVMWDGVTPWSPPAGTEVRANNVPTPLAIGQTTTV
jgi:hypothetical protein